MQDNQERLREGVERVIKDELAKVRSVGEGEGPRWVRGNEIFMRRVDEAVKCEWDSGWVQEVVEEMAVFDVGYLESFKLEMREVLGVDSDTQGQLLGLLRDHVRNAPKVNFRKNQEALKGLDRLLGGKLCERVYSELVAWYIERYLRLVYTVRGVFNDMRTTSGVSEDAIQYLKSLIDQGVDSKELDRNVNIHAQEGLGERLTIALERTQGRVIPEGNNSTKEAFIEYVGETSGVARETIQDIMNEIENKGVKVNCSAAIVRWIQGLLDKPLTSAEIKGVLVEYLDISQKTIAERERQQIGKSQEFNNEITVINGLLQRKLGTDLKLNQILCHLQERNTKLRQEVFVLERCEDQEETENLRFELERAAEENQILTEKLQCYRKEFHNLLSRKKSAFESQLATFTHLTEEHAILLLKYEECEHLIFEKNLEKSENSRTLQQLKTKTEELKSECETMKLRNSPMNQVTNCLLLILLTIVLMFGLFKYFFPQASFK